MKNMDRFDFCGFPRLVHLSVDDVGSSLRWLCQNKPENIWEMDFFGELLSLHHKYDAQFSLYCFYELGGSLCFNDIPPVYAEQFNACSDWLKFGFHAYDGQPFLNSSRWKEAFDCFEASATQLKMGKADILRLHYWKASEKQLRYLHERGVTTLLYLYDDERYTGNKFIDSGIVHRKTTVCFEKICDLNPCTLKIGDPVIIAFTHEKMFEHELEKIRVALKLYSGNGYEYFS